MNLYIMQQSSIISPNDGNYILVNLELNLNNGYEKPGLEMKHLA